jgi:hypothetical protein
MLDQKENQGYDLVVSISFDPVAGHGNGRGNNNGRGTIVIIIMLARATTIRVTLKQCKGSNY